MRHDVAARSGKKVERTRVENCTPGAWHREGERGNEAQSFEVYADPNGTAARPTATTVRRASVGMEHEPIPLCRSSLAP